MSKSQKQENGKNGIYQRMSHSIVFINKIEKQQRKEGPKVPKRAKNWPKNIPKGKKSKKDKKAQKGLKRPKRTPKAQKGSKDPKAPKGSSFW